MNWSEHIGANTNDEEVSVRGCNHAVKRWLRMSRMYYSCGLLYVYYFVHSFIHPYVCVCVCVCVFLSILYIPETCAHHVMYRVIRNDCRVLTTCHTEYT